MKMSRGERTHVKKIETQKEHLFVCQMFIRFHLDQSKHKQGDNLTLDPNLNKSFASNFNFNETTKHVFVIYLRIMYNINNNFF